MVDIDEVASDIDDLSTSVDELIEAAGKTEKPALDKLQDALKAARNASDEVEETKQ